MRLNDEHITVPRSQHDALTVNEDILTTVTEHQLPESLTPVLNEYKDTIGDRDLFLWRWAHHLFPAFTLSCVPPEDTAAIQNTKLVALMFVSVLDDLAEKYGDLATFEEAAKIPFEHRAVNYDRSGIDHDVLSFAETLWSHVSPDLQNGARYQDFAGIYHFDLNQVLTAIEYSYLANTNIPFVTETELRSHEAHNMMLFVFADIDLIHSPGFERGDLADLRRVVDCAQRMARIGNWITTWERELHEGDISSGIIVHALEHDIITSDDLAAIQTNGTKGDDVIEEIVSLIHEHDVEAVFLDEWRDERAVARDFEDELASIDIAAYLDGIETVMEYHLASRGLK